MLCVLPTVIIMIIITMSTQLGSGGHNRTPYCPPSLPTILGQCMASAAWGRRGDVRRWAPEFLITWTAASQPELVPMGVVTCPVKPHLQLFLGGADTSGAQAVVRDPVLGTSLLYRTEFTPPWS